MIFQVSFDSVRFSKQKAPIPSRKWRLFFLKKDSVILFQKHFFPLKKRDTFRYSYTAVHVTGRAVMKSNSHILRQMSTHDFVLSYIPFYSINEASIFRKKELFDFLYFY